MIDLAHEEVLLFLALLAFGNVLNSAAEAHGPAEIRHPQNKQACEPPPSGSRHFSAGSGTRLGRASDWRDRAPRRDPRKTFPHRLDVPAPGGPRSISHQRSRRKFPLSANPP